ncbi:Two-component transcriptional response regulator, LuxR family [Pseudomonas chlororaphis subsp. piscium]|uniref:response regulator transcription factor n=1 Tax=Pseudomonas chlororaphis TaxID=587753 RepID=UPI000F58CB74|nr:response regulator transcription factor [Pseudomonas chlororaphis]AZC51356.1 Two-component transcriptional response regulator, LuxR family [Pseudomonas chlororaphis subsp. piscium]AZC76649.1 Two-component transcriptional response regulator, LuxR family [Pseudomonas chlororaphis subsp. piscium]NNB43285.1 response regulator transcription factor [Pseudomonas chlororaphis]
MNKIKVVLADDHPIVLAGVKETIESDGVYDVVSVAKTSGELMDAIKEHSPDIVITDFYMPGDEHYGDGMRLVSYLVRNFPQVRFLVLTMLNNRSILGSLYDCGVSGVLQKSINLDEINVALRTISKGDIYKGNFTLEPDSVMASTSSASERIASITIKEAEVLRLFLAGERLKDIATSLQRSAKTVSTQKTSVMRKLCVHSDQELFAFCQEHQVV